jgi:predicted permease
MRRFLRRGRLDAERAREMQVHIDHHIDDLIAQGLAPDAASREAHRRFGNATAIREEIYNMNSVPVVEPLVRDVQYAVRMLRKTPGFTIVALLTLAVGIGVNTAVFSAVNALLLRPLPYPDAERLATIRISAHGARGDAIRNSILDGATFLAIRDNATTVDAAVRGSGGGVNLVAEHHADSVVQSRVSAGYFRVLGVRPFIGREFHPDDDRVGSAPVAVLSYRLWSRLFGSDPAAVGRTIMLRGEAYTVVGVMPQDFDDGGPPSAWLATKPELWTALRPSASGEGGGTNYSFVARLRPGATWAEASAEVDRVTAPVMARPTDATTHVSCSLIPLQTGDTADFRQALLMLWAAVGVVLLIACVNVSGLLLARSSARTREIATRMALGSGRAAVIRQLLVESAVLALLGGIAGVGLGWVVLEALTSLSTGVLSFGAPITLDARVLAATLALALVTSLIFGLVPSLHASRLDVQRALSQTGTRSVSAGGGWRRRALVVSEVAMGVVLLVSAGLLVRTFVLLENLSPGFDSSGVVTATVSLQDARYEDPIRMTQLFDETLRRVRRNPGVQAAGVTLGLPYTRLLNLGFNLWDGDGAPLNRNLANVSYITPGYFEALKVVVARGRDFSQADEAGSAPVAIVNEEFARRYYGATDAGLGRQLGVIVQGERREIVGIVGNTRTTTSGYQGYTDPLVTPPIIYVPATQLTPSIVKLVHTWFSPSWVVRGSGPIEGTSRALRNALTASDPLLPIARLESMSAVQAEALALQRFMMACVLGLSGVALLLAAIGIYGLIGSSVAERTRELGIRLALGATRGQVMRDVVRPGVALTAMGVGIGTAAAVPVARLMQSFIWGITATDPLTFAGVTIGLLIVALIASFIPARRVLGLDPAVTLRAE